MILVQELTALDSEIASLIALIEVKRQRAEVLTSAENLASEALSRLNQAVSRIEEIAPSAIASLKSAVLDLFDSGNDGGGNQPNNPTPDTDPTPGADNSEPELIAFNGETGDYLLSDGSTSFETPPLTYAQAIKKRCSACWGYEVETYADIKAGFVNRTSLNFMEAVNLERSGKEFYQTVEMYLDRLYYNGQACKLEECPQSSLVGQHYQLTSPLASLLWEDAPLLGQHCTIILSATEDNKNKSTNGGEAMPYVELVRVSEAIAYQKKSATGEIICAYFGFRTKAHAQSWLHFFEAVTYKVEMRQAKRLEDCKWEIKAKGLSMSQIERYARDCDFSKSYHTEVCSSKPPSYKEPQHPQPVNLDEAEPGDIVTSLLTPSASYKIIEIMADGILDCTNLTTGSRLGLRPAAVTLVQKATPETKIDPLTSILEQGDIVEVVSHRHPAHYGLVGTVEAIANFSELSLQVNTVRGTKGYERGDLKFISKGEKPRQQPNSSGQQLLGNRIVTTGNYTGLARRNAINNFRTGQADKLAAIELMKSGLTHEQAMAAVTGTDPDDIDF